MSKKLKKDLRKFAPGKDGGIDLVDDLDTKNIIVQVKHYTKTSNSGLINSLKKELPKVKKLNPSQYYICCSRELTPDNISEIYDVFKDYIESTKNPPYMLKNVRQDVNVTIDDKIITLSTCIGNGKTYRYLVQGVLTNVQETFPS